jgi:hypothetical protein
MRLGALAVLLAMVVLAGLMPSASAAIGAGSRMTVETQTQMLLNQGGGYVNWEISGPAALLVRQNVDQCFGNGDGNVTPVEASAYTNEIDLTLENYIFYGSARIIRSSLLNKDINTDTAGLIGPVNSTRAVEIHFTFSANLRVESGLVDFGDQRIPQAAFRALKGEANQTFEGELEWRHTEIVVGMASFSAVSPDRGSFSRFRGPGLEVLWYSLSVKGQNSTDRARFDTFNVVQCPMELFVVVCVFGAFTVYFPRHFMRTRKMLRYRWLHLGAVLMWAAAMAIFLLGADGRFVWLAAPLLAVLSLVLSWGVYSAKWKGLARSAVPALPSRPAEEARPVSPISQVISARQWADNLPAAGGTAVEGVASPPAGPPPPGPAREGPAPARPAPPAARLPVAPGPSHAAAAPRRELRCPRCKGTFPVEDNGARPLAIRCSICGAEGVLRK